MAKSRVAGNLAAVPELADTANLLTIRVSFKYDHAKNNSCPRNAKFGECPECAQQVMTQVEKWW